VALIKSIMTSIGVMSTYHVISALHLYPETPSAHIDVDSYVSKEMKDGGYAPLITHQFEFTEDAYPFGETISISGAYEAVKTREMFADAQESEG